MMRHVGQHVTSPVAIVTSGGFSLPLSVIDFNVVLQTKIELMMISHWR